MLGYIYMSATLMMFLAGLKNAVENNIGALIKYATLSGVFFYLFLKV